jgi:hypothetical protein
MSLGAQFALLLDGYGEVFQNAADAGVVVVASAGNDGNIGWITGAPAAHPRVLSVASVWPTNEMGDAVSLHYEREGAPVDEQIEAVEATPELAPQISDAEDITAPLAWFGRGCAGDPREGDVRGKIALIRRGVCEFKVKLDAAAGAGAVGAIVFSDGREMTPMGTNTGRTSIPAFMTSTSEGERVLTLLNDGVTVEATLTKDLKGAYPRHYLANVISGFSSRGPGRNDVFKPNISGVGSQINAPLVGSGDRGTKLDGTSMSGPTVAGAAAVLIERLRADGLAPAGPLTDQAKVAALDVSTLLVNGAQATVYSGSNTSGVPEALARGGAGRVDLSIATRLETEVRAGTRAADSPGTPFGVYFGFPRFDDVFNDERPFHVRNLSAAPKSYQIQTSFVFANDRGAGVTFTPSESTFTLAPGETKDLVLNLRADPSATKTYRAYGGDRANSAAGLTDAEYDAFVTVTEVSATGAPVAGGDVARLPVYVLPKPASMIEFVEESLAVTTSAEPTVNRVVNYGAGGVVDFFVPAGEDGVDVGLPPAVDIDKVGARVARDAEGQRVVEVFVHNKGPRAIPLDTQVWVGLDTDRNGALDYMAFAQDIGYWPPTRCGNNAVTITGNVGVVVTRVIGQNPLSFSCTGATINYVAGVDSYSSATVLPMLASDLGFADGDPVAFDFIVFHLEFLTAANPRVDGAPNDGAMVVGSSLSLGRGRFSFSQDGAGVSVDPWSLPMPGISQTAVNLTRVGNGSSVGPLLAYHRFGLPGKDLSELQVHEEAGPLRSVFLPALAK